MTVPYTYLLGWPEIDKWYYGVRYAKDCHPADLWNPYRTSSGKVGNLGEPSVIEVRRVFETEAEARAWEHKVLRRMKVIASDRWVNQTDNKAICPKAAATAKWTEERREAHRQRLIGQPSRNKGKKMSEESRLKMSIAHTGSKRSKETRRKMSELQKARGGYGPKKMSEEARQKMSESHKKRYAINKQKLEGVI